MKTFVSVSVNLSYYPDHKDEAVISVHIHCKLSRSNDFLSRDRRWAIQDENDLSKTKYFQQMRSLVIVNFLSLLTSSTFLTILSS